MREDVENAGETMTGRVTAGHLFPFRRLRAGGASGILPGWRGFMLRCRGVVSMGLFRGVKAPPLTTIATDDCGVNDVPESACLYVVLSAAAGVITESYRAA